MQTTVPEPLRSMNHDVTELAALIRRLPAIEPEFFLGIARQVRRVKDQLLSTATVDDVLRVLLDSDPTGTMTAISLERFQMHCTSNSEMFGCITRDERPSGPLSRSHYFNIMGTQSPTLDRSTGLECFSPVLSIHGSHDLWRRSAHENWELYGRLYGTTPGAAWLTVLLRRRCSHVHKSSKKGYTWTINVDYFDDGGIGSTRLKGSAGHELARYFALARESVERALARIDLHSPEHSLATVYDRVQSNAGVVVHDGNRIVAANRASERVLSTLLTEPLTEKAILRWLGDPACTDIQSVGRTNRGEKIVVFSRAAASMTRTDWSGPTTTRPFPKEERARVELFRLVESGVGVTMDCRDKLGFCCLCLPFQNYVGVGVDARGCRCVTSTQFQKMQQKALIGILACAREEPVLIMRRTIPTAIIIAAG